MWIFSLFFICLQRSLFVPDLNGQKVSDLIASRLLIAIYMFELLLIETRSSICLSLSIRVAVCGSFVVNSFTLLCTHRSGYVKV